MKVLVKQSVQRITYNIRFYLSAFVDDGNSSAVIDSLVDLVLVNVATESLVHLLAFKQWCSCKSNPGGIR